jgi:hypothetical protein
MRIERWLPLSGICSVVLVVASIIAGGNTPEVNTSMAHVATFYSAHSTQQFVSALLLVLAAPAVVFFALSLASNASADEVRSPWQVAVITGAGIVAATFLIGAAVQFTLADAGKDGVSGAALRALSMLNSDAALAFTAAIGVMMLCASGLLLSGRARRPRWLGWSALVLGIALLFRYADLPAAVFTAVWITVLSISLTHRRQSTPSTIEARSNTPLSAS